MSALDRAFIKAYAKDVPAPASATVDVPLPPQTKAQGGGAVVAAPRTRRGAERTAPAAHIIEQIYHEGSLYRIETPEPATPRRALVPAPHFKLPPRTSPKRNVRRSILRLLSGQQSPATPKPVEPLSARHSRRAVRNFTVLRSLGTIPAPPPVEADAAIELAPPVEIAPAARPTPPAIELPPEVIERPFEPAKAIPAPPKAPIAPLPVISPAKEAAPLNLAEEFGPRIKVEGHWDYELEVAASGALVCLPAPAELHHAGPPPLAELKQEALPEPIQLPLAGTKSGPGEVTKDVQSNSPGPGLVPAKDEPVFRLDATHAGSRAHLRYPPPAVIPEAAKPTPEPVAHSSAEEPVVQATLAPPAQPASQAVQPADEPVTFADLDPDSADQAIAAAAQIQQQLPALDEAAAEDTDTDADDADQPCIPQWEVDRFQWPAICERLMSDRDCYLAHAGTKLLAAVRDDLRTLAVTGSRPGEGRTTLALCLARAAASAGIQVALVDADFARPQLAVRVGLDVAHGWHDAALGKIPLSEAAVRSIADNITILPLESSAAEAGLSLADPRVTATLRAIAATFELVIIDLGPLAAGRGDLFPAGEDCPLDAAIVVRDLRHTTAGESLSIGERLHAAGIDAVGIAENFVVAEEVPDTSV